MAIDRIGNKGVPTPPPGDAPVAPTAARAPFHVPAARPADAPGASAPVHGAGPTALDRVRSGEISLDQYIDLKVDEATQHLTTASAVPPAALDGIRRSLRERIAADPALVDLVRTATGQEPTPTDATDGTDANDG